MRSATLFKKRLWHGCFFCKFCKIFQNVYLEKTPPVAASDMTLTSNFVNYYQPSVAFYRGTGHLICIANQLTGFYMKFNIGPKWVKLKFRVCCFCDHPRLLLFLYCVTFISKCIMFHTHCFFDIYKRNNASVKYLNGLDFELI